MRPAAPGQVFAHATRDGLLLVPVSEGGADLDAVVALNATGRALWEARDGDPDALAARLVERHGLAPVAAQAEVARFRRELNEHDLLPGDASTPPPQPDAPRPAVARLDADALVGLARAVLAGGHRLRFRARGLSMRPQIPDGAVLEVSPHEFAALRAGQIALYVAGDNRLVAHRLLGRTTDGWRARGDSAGRVDLVTPACHLGVVTARLERTPHGPRRVMLDTAPRRVLATLSSAAHRAGRFALRAVVVWPLRTVPALRRATGWSARLASSILRRLERVSARVRRRCDVATAALQTTAEKDLARRRLYATRSVRAFTALDENLTAGLTLIEEVMLARHPLPPGPILVLGCGPGREGVALARAGHAVTGLDRDAAMLDHARALADRERVSLDLVLGEADAFDLGARRFGAVVVFSGLYNMLLPSARREALLRCARAHLATGGRVYLTFLSDYVSPGAPPPLRVPTLAQAIVADHEEGDLWLQNETVHVFPHPDDLVAEARRAGLTVETMFRDQRAYDRATRQVRGYALLAPSP